MGFYLVGVAGFEPTNDGIKNRCLTTWRHPNRFKTVNTISDFSENCKHFFGKSQFFENKAGFGCATRDPRAAIRTGRRLFCMLARAQKWLAGQY